MHDSGNPLEDIYEERRGKSSARNSSGKAHERIRLSRMSRSDAIGSGSGETDQVVENRHFNRLRKDWAIVGHPTLLIDTKAGPTTNA